MCQTCTSATFDISAGLVWGPGLLRVQRQRDRRTAGFKGVQRRTHHGQREVRAVARHHSNSREIDVGIVSMKPWESEKQLCGGCCTRGYLSHPPEECKTWVCREKRQCYSPDAGMFRIRLGRFIPKNIIFESQQASVVANALSHAASLEVWERGPRQDPLKQQEP